MSSLTGERRYRIGEVAERVGVTTRTIRYYEELGLLGTAATRSKGTHRSYSEPDVARLTDLIRLRDLLGLSLEQLTLLAEAEEARACLRERWAESNSNSERLLILHSAIPHIERQLELVRSRQRTIDEFANELSEKLERMRALVGELQAAADGGDA